LNGPAADAALAGNLQHAFASAQSSLDALLDGGIDPRPTKLLSQRHSALEASVHALPDHAALKLGERAADLKHQLARRCGRVDRLMIEVRIDAALQRLAVAS
jgi:hypothetical protein